MVQRELEILNRRRERLDDLEQDKETVLEHYGWMAPEALDSLTSEERQRFYTLLRLKVTVEINCDLKRSGTFSRCCGHRTHNSGWTFSVRTSGTFRDVRFAPADAAKA